MLNKDKCYFCNSESEMTIIGTNKQTRFVNCPICGRYEVSSSFFEPELKDIVAAYLYHHEKERRERSSSFFYFLGEDNDFDKNSHEQSIPMRIVTKDEIKSFYPTQFSDRVNMSLLALANRSGYFGNIIHITDEEMFSLLFIRRFDDQGEPLQRERIHLQYKSILEYFEEQGYLAGRASSFDTTIQLLANGWKQIEKLQAEDNYNKEVFVSMSFADSTKPIREAIKEGIKQAGFSPKFMDEIIHNRQIVPEMFRLIRECRFLIMDISDPNYGAYYEAGYALGLGKEVIITCKEEVLSHKYVTDEEKKYERYLKPHFDIVQKQILVWSDYEDLTHKLTEWIKALFK